MRYPKYKKRRKLKKRSGKIIEIDRQILLWRDKLKPAKIGLGIKRRGKRKKKIINPWDLFTK